jgi:ABC-type bacteriocin/lantibiotic exporter with double-glycine peptidase domain
LRGEFWSSQGLVHVHFLTVPIQTSRSHVTVKISRHKLQWFIWYYQRHWSIFCECFVLIVFAQHYRVCACISRTFLTRIYPPKLECGLYTELKN